ncbi:MAG: NAD(P)H-binding protein, partial [Myxococcota bacterium]
MYAVVFGAGQIGSGLARKLSMAGHRVRVVRRSDRPVAGVEVVPGDARDAAFVRRVSEGADVLFHCMNPSAYTAAAWEAELPPLGDALIAAAPAPGAKLVCLDNLYGSGVVDRRA